MQMNHTPDGLVLSSTLGEQLRMVRALFDRGPNVPMDYGAEFNRQAAICRQRSMQDRQPVPELSPATA